MTYSNPQAFNMIDQNRDGFIDSEDLKDMLASLGKLPATVTLHTVYACVSLNRAGA
jgi:Ca2+-binding EF-hand superfamily protein